VESEPGRRSSENTVLNLCHPRLQRNYRVSGLVQWPLCTAIHNGQEQSVDQAVAKRALVPECLVASLPPERQTDRLPNPGEFG
jgi:hypothetical protein